MIAFSCLQCAKHYEIKEEFAGRQTKCRQCGHLLLIPHLTGSFVAAPSKAATVAVPPPTTQAGDPTATLFLARAKSATGFIYGVTITLDGQLIGTLQENERLTVKVSIGVHTIEVRGGGLHRSQTLAADSAQVLEFETYFSNWGILGGGLILRGMNDLACQVINTSGSQKRSKVTAFGVTAAVGTAIVLALILFLWGEAILAAITFVCTIIIGIVVTVIIMPFVFALEGKQICKHCSIMIPLSASVCPFCTRQLR